MSRCEPSVLVYSSSPVDNRLAHQDQPALEIDVLPLQAVDLAGAHAGEEAHGEVVAEILPHRGEDPLHLLEAEGLHVGLLDLQLFDVLEGVGKLKRSAASLRIIRNGFSILLILGLERTVCLPRAWTLASSARNASTSALAIWPTAFSPKRESGCPDWRAR
jgi:hypothetical protein